MIVTAHLYLVRHGQTAWSESGRHTGISDVPLTTHGVQQARRAGAVLARLRGTDLPPALALCSTRERSWRTAELVGLEAEKTEALAEWDYGDYEGLTTEQIREQVPGWTVWTHPCPNGETAEQVRDRAALVVDEARTGLRKGDVVLVGHGHFTRAVIAAWLGLGPEDGVRFALDPAGIAVLGDERGVPQVRSLNVPAWELASD
ncbi:putative phosphoglycerate mutase [Actinosynnema pretiosum]|nr:putative phosphoglycerate mutase [Actinosynnema pretiosum]